MLPYLAMISIALMYTICYQHVVVCSVIMCICTCGLYMLIYTFRRRPAGAAVITLLMLLLCGGALSMVGVSFADFIGFADVSAPSLFEEGGFVHFIFTASMTFDPINAAAAIILFSVVIGFVGCYFSAVLPRLCFLMLPSFIPMILSTRTAAGLPLWLVIPMFGTFLLAVLCSARKCEGSDTLVFTEERSWQRPAAAAGAAVLIIASASVIPRSTETPLKEIVDTVILGRIGFGNALGNFTSSSSVNTGDNDVPDNVLFIAMTDTPHHLDRWSFDIYNGEEGWSSHRDFEMGNSGWQDRAKELRPSMLFADLRYGAEEGLLDEYAEILTELPRTAPKVANVFIRAAENSATKVVMHPQGVYNVRIDSYSGRLYRTPKNEIFTDFDLFGMEYLMTFSAEEPCAEYAAAAEELGFRELLRLAEEREVISSDTANAFIHEYDEAEEYRLATGTEGISPEIMELAAEITEGLSTDYEKALAIEEWFGEQGFVYDLEFVPQSVLAEYFLFDSRRGICSDFATATTLLARAAGLTARYTEGFALSPDILDENNVYQVTGKNAHAYTQAYIAGCGWINLDATKYAVPAETVSSALTVWIIAAAGGVALLAVLIVIFKRPLWNVFFAVTYPVRGTGSRVRGVYLAARRLACDISGREEGSLSAGEMERILTNTLSMPLEAGEIRRAADELLYSGRSEISADTKRLYQCLKKLRRQKRRLRR